MLKEILQRPFWRGFKVCTFIFGVAIALAMQGCAVSMYQGLPENSQGACSETISGSVLAAYPTNGAHWNDYVEKDDAGGSSFYDQNDVACTTVTGGNQNCVHGGEIRSVEVTGTASCEGLSATDDLGAFVWRCFEVSGVATFYSVRLADDVGLSDLLDWSASPPEFRPNSVTVTGSGSCAVLTTDSSVWWSNDIREVTLDDANSQTLTNVDGTDAIGTIHTITTSGTSSGIVLNDPKQALVVQSGQTLTWGSGDTNNCDTTLECMVLALNSNFVWIEGRFNGDGVANAYYLKAQNSDYFRVHQSVIYNNDDDGIAIDSTSTNAKITFSKIISNGTAGVANGIDPDAEGLHLYNVVLANNSDYGMLSASQGTLAQKVIAASNQIGGYVFNPSTDDSILSEIIALGGIIDMRGDRTTLASGTFIFSGTGRAIQFAGGSGSHRASNLYYVSGTNGGIDLDGPSSIYTQLAGFDSDVIRILSAAADNNEFYSEFILGGTPTCYIDAGATTPTLDASCNHGTAAGNAPLTTTADFSTSIIGKATADSTSTIEDGSGQTDYDTNLAPGTSPENWYTFDSFYRNWGKSDVAAYPDANHRGACTATETCQLWDLRILSSDSTGILEVHGAPTNGADCPASINGSPTDTESIILTNTNTYYGASTYLVNAVEIWGDGIGNDNGLCENNEECIFHPNIGAFLGEGNYLNQTCNVTQAGFTGVTMYFYECAYGQN